MESMMGVMNQITTKSPMYNVSRPVSVREYDATSPSAAENLYPPFGNHSVAMDQRTPLPMVNRMGKLLSPTASTSQFQMFTMNRMRFNNDKLPDEEMQRSLELKRNMSRSLDVRTPYSPSGDGQDSNTPITPQISGTVSPLPSRRRTQKLAAAPLPLDANNCKKSKSLLIKKADRKLKARTFGQNGIVNTENVRPHDRLTVKCKGAEQVVRRNSSNNSSKG